jgi:hypothetical protein
MNAEQHAALVARALKWLKSQFFTDHEVEALLVRMVEKSRFVGEVHEKKTGDGR